ncbi:MAG: hypothetical protein AB7W59_02260 [Acidimicrobiia bacterium]
MNPLADIAALRQVLVSGRVSEAITGRALAGFTAQLDVVGDGWARSLPVDATLKAQGWYALSCSGPSGHLILPPEDEVELRLSITLPDGRRGRAGVTSTGAELTPVRQPVTIAGEIHDLLVVPAAPIRLDCSIPPAPIALSGQVIIDNDPRATVAGATISIGELTTTSDASGSFQLGPIPLEAVLVVQIIADAASVEATFRPDFTNRNNTAVFSVDL